MKIRNGFVSNSSSSSFVVEKKYLTKEQINLILHPNKHICIIQSMFFKCTDYVVDLENDETIGIQFEEWFRNELGLIEYVSEWEIEETDTEIKGYTNMDNFDYISFLRMFNIPIKKYDGDNV